MKEDRGATSKKPVISVRDLVVQYDGDTILDRVSLDVYEKEIFVILGGSGCGKSTLLRQMIGLETPLEGEVVIDGVDITSCSEKEFYDHLLKIGVLFQNSALLGSLTLEENVCLPVRQHTRLRAGSVMNMARMKLRLVGLECYNEHLPSEISGGMKKRAALARALALNPGILFLDEPSAGLDPVTSSEIDELILRINSLSGTTMVIVTHELDSIYRVADRCIMLDKSTKGIIAEGDPKALKEESDHPLVKRFFHRGQTGK